MSIKKMKSLPEQYSVFCSEKSKLDVLCVTSILELSMYGATGEFEKAALAIKNIGKDLPKIEAKWPKSYLTIFHYNVAYSFFGNKEYRTSLRWLGKILNDKETELSDDIHSFSHILRIIIHIELESKDVLEYAVKSTTQFLLKKKKLYRTEEFLLRFIKEKLLYENDKKKLVLLYKDIKKKLQVILKDPVEEKVLTYFDFISWLDSKIENKSFADVIKNKTPSKFI